MAQLLLAAILFSGLATGVFSQSDLNEANALIIIKASAGAPQGLVNWNGTDPCGDAWLGVQCTPANGTQTRYVTGLQLPGFGLSGTLSPALGLLPNLQILDLSQNELEGAIPREFQNLTQLEQLDLHNNNLVATLDPWVGSMPRLVRMDLSQNSVWGRLPDSLFRLTQLQRLNLGGCICTGSIPPSIGNLTNLQLLDLSFNYLKGSIPPQLGQLTQLQGLLLQNNSFSGAIPADLANLTSLTYLYLQGNNLTGSIPSQLTAMPDLIARYDGNPLCQDVNNMPLCAVFPRNGPADPVSSLTPMPPPANVTISTSAPGVVNVAPWNGSGTSVISGQTPLTGTCIPGSQQLCVCGADGQMGRGVCSGNGLAIVDCACNTRSSSGRSWSTTAIVLVAVLPAVFVLLLIGVVCCFALAFLKQRRKTEAILGSGKGGNHDVEKGHIERQAPVGSIAFMDNASRSTNSVKSIHLGGASRTTSPRGLPPPPHRISHSATSPSSSTHTPTGSHESNSAAGSYLSKGKSKAAANPLYDEEGGVKSPEIYKPGDPPLLFSFEELKAATDGFSGKALLGGSGFGRVYMGKVDGTDVVVKRLNELQGIRNQYTEAPLQDHFKPEVDLMSRLDHPNLMHLVGYCNDGKERCLVYPYMVNRSLDERLHGDAYRQPLEWQERLSIAAQSAGALAYLHQNGIIHRDFRTSNVLLDAEMRAVVSDFGIAKLSVEEGAIAEEVTSQLVRSSGYMAPEYGRGDVTEKGDVYSFGVVLLELMTGRPAVSKEGVSLVQWAVEYMHREPEYMEEIIDPRLEGSWPSIPFFWTVELAGACIDTDPAARPNMVDVARAINFVLQHATGGPQGSTPASLTVSQLSSAKPSPGHSRNSSGGSLFELAKGWNSPPGHSRHASIEEEEETEPHHKHSLSHDSLLDGVETESSGSIEGPRPKVKVSKPWK